MSAAALRRRVSAICARRLGGAGAVVEVSEAEKGGGGAAEFHQVTESAGFVLGC
jgi:phytoene dehydrogenase-like protein